MLSFEHAMLTKLFEKCPTLAPTLLEARSGIRVPTFRTAEVVSADLTDCAPTEFRADGPCSCGTTPVGSL